MSSLVDQLNASDLSEKSRQRLEEKRRKIFRSMTAAEKLDAAAKLYYSALTLKQAHLGRKYREWTKSKIEKKAREWMLYART